MTSAGESDAGTPDSARKQTIRDSVGVGIAVGGYGVAFGAASVAAGFSPAQSAVSSLFTFTGGSQFAIAGVVAGGGTAAAALGSGYLLGARNTLYGLRLSPILAVRGWRRALAALVTIDESTAMSLAQRSPTLARLAFWWTAASLYVLWNISTLAGAIGAQALGDPRRFGLDAAVPAAFLALLVSQVRSSELKKSTSLDSNRLDSNRLDSNRLDSNRESRRRRLTVSRSVLIAVVAAGIAALLIPITPPGIPVLAAGLALVLGFTSAAVRNESSCDDSEIKSSCDDSETEL